MTVWTCDRNAISEQERSMCSDILGSFGEELFVEDEEYLDMSTAISGTGPAYFFLILETVIGEADPRSVQPLYSL